jgi:hypothetical protein
LKVDGRAGLKLDDGIRSNRLPEYMWSFKKWSTPSFVQYSYQPGCNVPFTAQARSVISASAIKFRRVFFTKGFSSLSGTGAVPARLAQCGG